MKKNIIVYAIMLMFFIIAVPLSIKADIFDDIADVFNSHGFIMLLIILLLFIFTFILFKNYRDLKNKNRVLENFNKLRQIFIDADDSLIYLKDEKLKYIFVNKTAADFYNLSKEEIIGLDDYDLTDEFFADIRHNTDLKVMETGELVEEEVRWNGHIYKTTKFPVELISGDYGIGAYIKDVTEEYKLSQELKVEKNKYFRTLLFIGDGVILVNNDRKIEMINKAAERLTGWHFEEAEGRDYRDVLNFIYLNNDKELTDPIEAVFASGKVEKLEDNAALISKNGEKYFLDDSAAPIFDANGDLYGVVIVFRDATTEKKRQEKIEYLSYHDPMTGLYNRRFFEEELKRLNVERNLPVSIIIGDLDGLKLTNDIFGHDAGDKLIQQAAEAFKEACRKDDIIARWGGDEFVVLLPDTGKEDAEAVKERINECFESKKALALAAGISMGVGTQEEKAGEIIDYLNKAESAMYSSKSVSRTSNDQIHINNIIDILHSKCAREKTHAENVYNLSVKFAEELKLDKSVLKKIKNASYFHDIGKVAVDTDILNKKEFLTDKEYEDMKLHVSTGYRILNYFNHTIDIADDVLSHHERWDGNGYPRGLKGKEISMIARIIAVVETFESMTAADSYSCKHSREEALTEIRRCAGTQFDPALAEKFIKFIS
ncbi:diguanylate cyclase [Halanaerobium sp. MA284_MarDTE_T2]|uniref:diguanylate cyclase n=1 Tax=Halanaerobium sp. MA284_MarDTE_T2 TaxID=2183913 RepID=UPI000DF2F0A1|nr:diguanylate cyclase [Halanaerobium sp. MA284_MarDTE_T2]RCW43846.1 PAS domain S-box-containing protein/diguanylate cyclase (GGDEF)-like protein [Halanaerobium sp. MA284_MarDTE_T2]